MYVVVILHNGIVYKIYSKYIKTIKRKREYAIS